MSLNINQSLYCHSHIAMLAVHIMQAMYGTTCSGACMSITGTALATTIHKKIVMQAFYSAAVVQYSTISVVQ